MLDRPVGRPAEGAHRERGSAVVEFLGATLLLLVPLVYLILVLAQLQSGAFAAEAAAREAGRVVAQASSWEHASRQAQAAVKLAFGDQGIDVDGTHVLRLDCELDPCLSPGGHIHVSVAATVALPLVPGFLQDAVPMSVPVTAEHVAVVDTFAARP